jgi:maleylacetoacetate isomerase
MSMKLHGYFRSSAAWRLRIALALKGIAVEQDFWHLRRGEQRSAAYLAINPTGLVPALDTGAGVLTQSLAILEYLDETVPEPPLLPRGAMARARVRALALTIACDIHPMQNPRIQSFIRGQYGADEAGGVAWCAHWNKIGLDSLEQLVQRDRPAGVFCHGDRPTQADICLLPQLGSARRFGVEVSPYPTLLAIEAACLALPAFADAVPGRQPDAE